MNVSNDPAAEAFGLEHRQVWALLPWLVNGSASDEQRALANKHLADCADCRTELSLQQRLQHAIVADDPRLAGDVEDGLQRLLGRLDAPSNVSSPVAASTSSSHRPTSRLTAWLTAAVVVQAIGLGVLGLRQGETGQDGYRTLTAASSAAKEAATLRVVPAPDMTLSQWQSLLHANGLHVVDGPNAVGAYALASDEPVQQSAAEQLAHLRAAANIRFAEPILSAK